MNVPQSLPLANVPAFTPHGARAVPDAQGWKSALAQAQPWRVESLPPPTIGAPGHLHGAVFLTGTAPTDRELAATKTFFTAPAAAVGDGTLRAAAVYFPLQFAGSPAAPIQDIAETNAPAVLRNTPAPVRDEGVPPAHRRAPQSAEPQPLHVHVEPHLAGLAVWIGIAGGGETAAQRAAAVLDELRRTLRGTERIAQVVCNGTAIANAPRVHKETP